jgi:hypothetical protein
MYCYTYIIIGGMTKEELRESYKEVGDEWFRSSWVLFVNECLFGFSSTGSIGSYFNPFKC